MTERVVDLPSCRSCGGSLLPFLACNTCGYVSILRNANEVDRFLACPECTATNEIQLLCDRCHRRYPFESVPPPSRPPSVCPSCATFLGPEDTVCPTCGQRFGVNAASAPQSKTRGKRRIKGTRDDRHAQEIRRLPGINELQARALLQQGYDALWKLKRASEDELARVPEVGRAGARAIKVVLLSIPHVPEYRARETVLDEEFECPLCGCVTSAFSSTCLECGATFDEEEIDEGVRASLVQEGAKGLLAFYDLRLQDSPEDPELWYARGLLMEAIGEDAGATESLERAANLSAKRKIAIARTRLLSKASHKPEAADRLRSMLRDIVDDTALDAEMAAFQRSISDRGPTCPVCDEPLSPVAKICPACSTVIDRTAPREAARPRATAERDFLESLMEELKPHAPAVEPEPTTPASLESMVEAFEKSFSPEELERMKLSTIDWLMEELEESVEEEGAEEVPSPPRIPPQVARPQAPPAPTRAHVSTEAGFLTKSKLWKIGVRKGKGSVNGRSRVNGLTNGRVNGFINGRGRVNGFINGRGYVNGSGLTMVRSPSASRRTTYEAIGAGFLITLLILGVLLLPPPSPTAPIVIDGVFQDWAPVPAFDAATRSLNPNVEISRYASFLYRDGLYLYAKTRGPTFGDWVGYDGIFFLIDGDGDASTGFRFAGVGADFVAELDGGNESVASARLYTFPPDAELNWSRRQAEPGISAAASANGVELQVPLLDRTPFSPDSFRVAVYADDFEVSSSRSQATLSRSEGAILLGSRPLTTVVGVAPTDLLEIQIRALGLVAGGETWTISSFQLNATSGLTTSLSAESVNLTRDRPSASIRVTVQAPGFLPGDVVQVEVQGAASPKPLSIIGEPARAYVGVPSTMKRVDGLFEDWYLDSVADTDPKPVNNSDVDIIRSGAARDPTTAFFYIRVAGDLLDGSMPQHVVRVPRGSGGGGPPGSPPGNVTRPPRQTGEDVLRVYVDVNASDSVGFPIESIFADELLEIRGQDGWVTSRTLYMWSNGWTKVTGGPISLAKNTTSIEGSFTLGSNGNGTRIVFVTTDWSGISDVTGPVIAVVQAPPPLTGFTVWVQAPEFETVAVPVFGAVLVGLAFILRRRRKAHGNS